MQLISVRAPSWRVKLQNFLCREELVAAWLLARRRFGNQRAWTSL